MFAVMPSAMPTSRQSPPKRPKLSLHTSDVSPLSAGHMTRTALNMTAATDSSAVANTYADAFSPPSPVPSATYYPVASADTESNGPPSSSGSSGCSTISGGSSPSSATVPYSLSIGSHSILRNSPLPRRMISSTIARTAMVFFPRVKRVCFHEKLEEVIPIQIADETSDTLGLSEADTSDKRLQDEIAERKALDELLEEEASTTSIHGRRKRRRDWIWRPLEDDILASHRENLLATEGTADGTRQSRCVPELKREKTAREDTCGEELFEGGVL